MLSLGSASFFSVKLCKLGRLVRDTGRQVHTSNKREMPHTQSHLSSFIELRFEWTTKHGSNKGS